MKKNLGLLCATILFLTIAACSNKKDDPKPSNSNPLNPNAPNALYFKGTFDNVAYNQASSASTNAFNNGVGSSSVGNYVDQNSDNYVYEYWEGSYWSKVSFSGGQFTQKDALVMRVHKSFEYVEYDYPSEEDIQNIFAVGNYTNFSVASSDGDYPTTQGWDITLIDNNGKEWSSYKGTPNQTGSFVKIDSQKDVYIRGDRFLSAKGTMSCKLYDQNGNVKVLTGSFNQLFSSYSLN